MKKYIIPPKFGFELSEFKKHLKVADQKPILIVGPSGVGKSVFIDYAKEYLTHKNKEIPFVVIDCSHFIGADPSMARSELFGHLKGSFTGASSNQEGLLKRAKGGIVVLEEIGELPEDVQSMLLTVIETGRFRKIGSNKWEENINVQIIGVTNDDEKLREELRYRFFPFYISPLHKRREDILYYLAYFFSELMSKLRPWEVLSLLTYNWPGNVREIDRIGLLFLKEKLDDDQLDEGYGRITSAILCPDKRLTNLSALRISELFNRVKKYGVDTILLESVLNKFLVGIDLKNNTSAFKTEIKLNIDTYNNFLFLDYEEVFEKAYKGLELFNALFQRSFWEDNNLLEETDNLTIPIFPFSHLIKKQSKKLYKLQKDIFEFVLKVKLPPHTKKLPDPYTDEYEKLMKDLEQEKNEDNMESLVNYNFDELLHIYFNSLLKESNGNVTEAAQKAGLPRSTFRNKLAKYE